MPKPTREQIEEQLGLAYDGADSGSKWPGMSYEQGVANALDWALGNVDSKPMDD